MAYTIDVFDSQGKKLSTKDLDSMVFSSDFINEDILSQFVRMQQANMRSTIASTKNRGEVRGSGKKLYRQKGTGNARVGDKKSPIRRKGGVVWGPRTERNYTLKMPRKMRRAAMRSALSLQASKNGFLMLEDYDAETVSTKQAMSVLTNLNLSRSVLVICDTDAVMLSCRNIPFVDVLEPHAVSVYDILKAKNVVLIGSVLDALVASAKN